MQNINLTRVEGVVASVLDSGGFSVRLADGQSLRARISRRLGLLNARFAVGDSVLVGILLQSKHEGLILTGAKARPSG